MTTTAVSALTDRAASHGIASGADSQEPSLWPSIAAAFSLPRRAPP